MAFGYWQLRFVCCCGFITPNFHHLPNDSAWINQRQLWESSMDDFKPFCRTHTWMPFKTSMTSLPQRKKFETIRNHFAFTEAELQLECWRPVIIETVAVLQRENGTMFRIGRNSQTEGRGHHGQTSGTSSFQVSNFCRNKPEDLTSKNICELKKTQTKQLMWGISTLPL